MQCRQLRVNEPETVMAEKSLERELGQVRSSRRRIYKSMLTPTKQTISQYRTLMTCNELEDSLKEEITKSVYCERV